jgi:HYR domain
MILQIPGNYFGLGSHQIIYEAKDAAGYRSRCVFKIIVNAPKHSGFSSLQLPILYNKFYK